MLSRCDGVDEDSEELQSGRQNAQHAYGCQPDEQDAAPTHATDDGRHVSHHLIQFLPYFQILNVCFAAYTRFCDGAV